MAIDTVYKRVSMLHLALPGQFTVLPGANGSIDALDRATFLHLYGGIAFASPGGFSAFWARFNTQITGPAGMGPTNHA